MDLDMDPHDNEPIEPAGPGVMGDDELPGFSDYGDSIVSSGFTSLASYVLRHSHEGGRRYQSLRQGSYPLPNDDIEQEREEMKHQMIKRLLDGRDFLAPIDERPQKILDIGTGVGLWAIDVADDYPSAQVIGVDLSPIQSPAIPHNVVWRIDDIENTSWHPPYSDLDFVHLRSITVTLGDPIQVIQRSYQNLKPGGWIEFQECSTIVGCDDDSMPPDYAVRRFFDLFNESFAPAHNWDPFVIHRLPQILAKVGFVNAHYRRHKIPVGAWAKDRKRRELGLFMSKHVVWQLVGAVLAKWPDAGLRSKGEAQTLEQDVRSSLDDASIHAYLPWISVWTQKPTS